MGNVTDKGDITASNELQEDGKEKKGTISKICTNKKNLTSF